LNADRLFGKVLNENHAWQGKLGYPTAEEQATVTMS